MTQNKVTPEGCISYEEDLYKDLKSPYIGAAYKADGTDVIQQCIEDVQNAATEDLQKQVNELFEALQNVKRLIDSGTGNSLGGKWGNKSIYDLGMPKSDLLDEEFSILTKHTQKG